MRWEKLPAEGLFYKRFFTRWEPSSLKREKSHIPVQGHPPTQEIGRKSNQERKRFLAIISLCQIKTQTIGITRYSENFKLSFVVFLQEGSLVVKWFFSDRKIPLWENIPSTSQTPTN